MNDEIIEFISNINSTTFDEYSANSDIECNLHIDNNLYDYDSNWISDVEEYLPFVSSIVNNDYTDTTDTVVLKSYENRFIKTLVYRLYDYLLTEKNKINNYSINDYSKSINSKVSSIIENEKIDIEINIKSKNLVDNNKQQLGLDILERIERLLDITTSLINSSFIKNLEDVSLIQENVEKTELFDQEINYKKAYELYNLLNKYILNTNDNDELKYKKNLEKRTIITSYLEYQLFNEYLKEYNNPNIYKEYLEKIIEKIVSESSMDEKSFKKMITKKFEGEYLKKKNREKTIQSIFLKTQDNYNKQLKDAIREIKG